MRGRNNTALRTSRLFRFGPSLPGLSSRHRSDGEPWFPVRAAPVPEPFPPPDEGQPPEPARVPEPFPPPDEGDRPQQPTVPGSGTQ